MFFFCFLKLFIWSCCWKYLWKLCKLERWWH